MSETPGGRNVRAVKLIAIDNSKGRSDSPVLEETGDGIFLRGPQKNKLSWRDTYRAMAVAGEDWRNLDATVADGLD